MWIIGYMAIIFIVGFILFILVAQLLGSIRYFFIDIIREANGTKDITDLYVELHSIKRYLEQIHEEQMKHNRK